MPALKVNLLLVLLLLLQACSSPPPKGRYSMSQDEAPKNAPDVSGIEDAHPRYEPYSRQGNKPYTVLGKSYQVLPSGENFRQSGIASWYGQKFHGHLTSNGETYDMYSMSAAHKTLPLPSYVRVTNLDNSKQIIVRVNDRGPFHEGRIIDLSYAAAHKLGVLQTGTARVQIETIYFPPPSALPLAELADNQSYFIQLLASADRAKLERLGQELQRKYQLNFRLVQVQQLYRLQLGPIGQQRLANQLLQTVQAEGYPSGYLVTEPKS
ncbi:septal ring lytic transglycosylase RlpA family protein [Shewanella sedimentimangrovi]|uniref:Endolytic peptidoglycan transglycosylase RlpA n=1 Tax=Shewanella sedimentimangrovi TaxID=2814293 RepID=A0ABX7QYL2_9GAMM|nr:septal ring lytic transglycosylase RlpA family protein [Shewanella sedimentimangrovi]QSX36334.1 septal ring lytic transglycosylase RlpA family protein [Shewanella sedimentimangrovi]